MSIEHVQIPEPTVTQVDYRSYMTFSRGEIVGPVERVWLAEGEGISVRHPLREEAIKSWCAAYRASQNAEQQAAFKRLLAAVPGMF
jgi:hypothetical protein